MSELAGEILDRARRAYAEAADGERARVMAAYLRDQFPFYGIPMSTRRPIDRRFLAGLPRPEEADLREIALACWAEPQRELQYLACDLLQRHARRLSAAFLDTLQKLIMTRSWWDTVDALAARVVGPVVARHPGLATTMDTWAAGEHLWLSRTALLFQLRYREQTDAARLFRYCLELAGRPDFFLRKGIGWALREYAKTDPGAVRTFVHKHRARLSNLSAREALRNIGP